MDISIIIPSYNRLWSLPKAVDSCRDNALQIQTIVIDDGSTDGTREWLSTQPDILVVHQHNQGKDWAVNQGFKLATGKYIRFLDADDWLLPGSNPALFSKAEKDNLDVVCAGYQLFNETEQFLNEVSWTVCDDFLAQQLGECDSSHYSAYLFKREFIADIPHRQEYGALDDRQFVIEVALKQPKTRYITIPTLAHRIHDKERLQSVTGLQRSYNHWAHYSIYVKALDRLQESGRLSTRYKNAACNVLFHLAHWVASSHIADGYKIYKWVYQLNPGFIPNDDSGLKLAKTYKRIGFKATEKILKLKRDIGL